MRVTRRDWKTKRTHSECSFNYLQGSLSPECAPQNVAEIVAERFTAMDAVQCNGTRSGSNEFWWQTDREISHSMSLNWALSFAAFATCTPRRVSVRIEAATEKAVAIPYDASTWYTTTTATWIIICNDHPAPSAASRCSGTSDTLACRTASAAQRGCGADTFTLHQQFRVARASWVRTTEQIPKYYNGASAPFVQHAIVYMNGMSRAARQWLRVRHTHTAPVMLGIQLHWQNWNKTASMAFCDPSLDFLPLNQFKWSDISDFTLSSVACSAEEQIMNGIFLESSTVELWSCQQCYYWNQGTLLNAHLHLLRMSVSMINAMRLCIVHTRVQFIYRPN